MASSGNAILIKWYPDVMRCELVRRNESKTYVFKFKIPDVKKSEVKGNVQANYVNSRSFGFMVNRGGGVWIKCVVSNLPEDMDMAKTPAVKVEDEIIELTVKKTTKNNWDSLVVSDEWQRKNSPGDVN